MNPQEDVIAPRLLTPALVILVESANYILGPLLAINTRETDEHNVNVICRITQPSFEKLRDIFYMLLEKFIVREVFAEELVKHLVDSIVDNPHEANVLSRFKSGPVH